MSHHQVQHLTTSRVLELLHVDLMGPMQVESLGDKRYVYVCVDDYSRFTRVYFLREKSDTFETFQTICLRLQHEKGTTIGKVVRIQSDHGRELKYF